jgi:hypothetical protein
MIPRSDATLNHIHNLKAQLAQLEGLRGAKTDKRGLISQAVGLLVGEPDPGEYTDIVLDRLEGFLTLEIEAKWAEYLRHFRNEQSS